MHLFQRIACLFGFHKRSRNAVSFHGFHPSSKCRGCGTAMVKIDGRWRTGNDDSRRPSARS